MGWRFKEKNDLACDPVPQEKPFHVHQKEGCVTQQPIPPALEPPEIQWRGMKRGGRGVGSKGKIEKLKKGRDEWGRGEGTGKEESSQLCPPL